MASKTLPREIIVEILTRLRVKDLLRFRCVSKPWCSLIDGPDFIKLHLSRSLETNNNTGVVSFDRPSLGWTDLGDLENSVIDLAKIPMTVSPDHRIVNACNGVVMLADLLGHGGDVFLFNPATRRSWKVPVSDCGDRPKDLSLFMSESHVIGFCYDHETDDYKLLRESFGEINGASPPSRRVEVYSLKSRSWKRVRGLKRHHAYNHCTSALVHNTLHWVVKPHSYFAPSVIIASYDVAAEKYAEVALPPCGGDPFYVTVAELRGKLCVLCHYGGSLPGKPQQLPPPRVMTVYEVAMSRMVADRVDVWAMEEYGDAASWGKLFSVSRTAETGDFVSFTPLAFLSNELVLLNVEGGADRFLVYNLAMERMVSKVRISGISKGVSAFGCVGTLVGIGGGYEEVTYRKLNQKKIKRTERVGPSEKKKNKRDDFLSKGFKLVL